ncbi:MAG: alanine racemase, partial [Gammaproteobacteria bacterium]|nr:alanine racemase [Gammaproteobacteria bacterium]NIR94751.1 alanine racemase [Gammaproteobacteria bacterium]NIW49874.1 alanine racemase [Gammaproteobacteria bacterium]
MKVDTGMHRLGFLPDECRAIWQRLKACPAVSDIMHMMSHFAVASE